MKLLFFRGKSFVSRGIKFMTWGEYSHVGVLTDEGTIIEAWHKGGVLENNLGNLPHTPGTMVDVFDVTIPINMRKFINGLREEVGKGYDFSGIWGFIGRNKSENPDKWFCSELVFAKLARAGCLALKCPARKVDPTLLSYSPHLRFVETMQIC